MAISNKDIISGIIKKYPTLNNHSSKDALKLLTDVGYEEVTMDDPEFTSGFFGLMLRVYLQQVNISQAKNPLSAAGFGEYYDQQFGGITQRMAVNSVKPINPGWKNLKNGDSPDPFVVRKPDVKERFFAQNFDYASLITVPDSYEMKKIFVSEYGMSEFMGGIMKGMENGYTLQEYLMTKDALNAAMHSTKYPMLDTQKVTITLSANPTQDELKDLILKVKNVATMMGIDAQSGAFNAMKFKSTQDTGRLKLLIRAGMMNAIQVNVLATAFNAENLNLPVDVIPVTDFGGLKPTNSSGDALYPVYDSLGTQIGYNTVEGQSEVTVQNDDVVWADPNEKVVAMLADKGLVFTTRQNPYRVEPIRNPRGLYTNYWATSPNNAINVDMLYNFVTFETEE